MSSWTKVIGFANGPKEDQFDIARLLVVFVLSTWHREIRMLQADDRSDSTMLPLAQHMVSRVS